MYKPSSGPRHLKRVRARRIQVQDNENGSMLNSFGSEIFHFRSELEHFGSKSLKTGPCYKVSGPRHSFSGPSYKVRVRDVIRNKNARRRPVKGWLRVALLTKQGCQLYLYWDFSRGNLFQFPGIFQGSFQLLHGYLRSLKWLNIHYYQFIHLNFSIFPQNLFS